jgi:hypothetical protein
MIMMIIMIMVATYTDLCYKFHLKTVSVLVEPEIDLPLGKLADRRKTVVESYVVYPII